VIALLTAAMLHDGMAPAQQSNHLLSQTSVLLGGRDYCLWLLAASTITLSCHLTLRWAARCENAVHAGRSQYGPVPDAAAGDRHRRSRFL